MKPNPHRPLTERLRLCACTAAALATTALPAVAGAAVILDPYLAGQFGEGTGANATFLHIDDEWRGTQVYWREPRGRSENGKYSNEALPNFARIGTLDWGTGIWGLADWYAINVDHSVQPVTSWTGVVARIDHADAEYAGSGYSTTWGTIGSLPDGLFDDPGAQNNWTAHYSGFLRITDPGEYNFGVLYDDGFFLRIWGADGGMFEISSDFLSPRDRLGFDQDFFLSTGLYRFELGAYDRLEVGAVNLAWRQDGHWVTVPTEHLVNEPIPVPTPGTAVLLMAGIGALAVARRKRKRG